jgi:natural product biosynthesis luciferase-like monooxygenase protein
VKFGMLHLFESPAGRSEVDMINEQVNLMKHAETMEYDSVWPAEHHFTEYGVCASPALTLAAIARETSKIRLGTGVLVLPFYNPIRVAEEFAMLDCLSGGRVDLGVGRGYQPVEFAGFGVDQTQSMEIFSESLEIIQKCWAEDSFSYQGKHFQIPEINVRPKPLQKPNPPIWMAALASEASFRYAGRNGFNLLCSPIFGGSLEVAKDLIKIYREELDAAGYDPSTREVGALVQVYAGDTQEQAREEFAEAVLWYFRTLGKYVAQKAGQADVPSYEAYAPFRDLAASVSWDELLASGTVICGDTDHVTESLRDIGETAGVDHILSWTRVGGLAEDLVQGHMEKMRDKIMPALR